MPVTVKPASHKPSEVQHRGSESAEALLGASCSYEHLSCKVLLQSSIDLTSSNPLYAASNGFVNAAVTAYSSHHHLVIRPEDVWIAILTQFSIYVNYHAEELRGKFVSFEGKKELEIGTVGNRRTVNFGMLAERMCYLLELNVVDRELRNWIIPGFSTTTETDKMVAAIIMMSTLQKYFNFKMTLLCGLPSATLLGELADWERLLEKIEMLKTFGEEPSMWYHLLKPVLTGFIKTFTDPGSEIVTTFWNRIAHFEGGGSGPRYYSGWITAFCFWDDGGKMLYKPPVTQPNHDDRIAEPLLNMGPMGSSMTSTTSTITANLNQSKNSKRERTLSLTNCPVLPDDIIYHRVDTNDVPAGYSSVPVKIDDNGDVFMSTMIAGSVGMRGSSSREEVAVQPRGYGYVKDDTLGTIGKVGTTGIDTLQPEVGWFIFERKPDDEV